MGLRVFVSVFILTINAVCGTAHAQSDALARDERVVFPLLRAPLTTFQKMRLSVEERNLGQGRFSAQLRIPSDPTPVPAVVLIHTCHGEQHYRAWIDTLNSWGLATLSVSRCQPPDNQPDDVSVPSLDWKRGALVAYSALHFLRSLEEIDGQAVTIMGWSRLGAIPLSVLNYEGAYQFFDHHFIGGIALYPFCSFARGPHAGPILVITAEHDDYVDPSVCARMGHETRNDPFPTRIKIMPGAWHGFDLAHYGAVHLASRDEINPDGFSASGGTVGYSRVAHTDAVREVRAFLRTLLGSERLR